MAMTNQNISIIPAGTAVAAGGTEAAPPTNGTGAIVGPFADYVNVFTVRITNGASPPASPSPMTVKLYASYANASDWTEVGVVVGDFIANSSFSVPIQVPGGFSYFMAKAYGAATNGATVGVRLMRQVP